MAIKKHWLGQCERCKENLYFPPWPAIIMRATKPNGIACRKCVRVDDPSTYYTPLRMSRPYSPGAVIPGGGLPVTRDANGTAQEFSVGQTSADYTGLTVGAHANLALILHVEFAGDPGTVSCHWDPSGTNQLLQFIGEVVVGTRHMQMYGLVNPAQGNKILNVTTTNSTSWLVHATSYYNVDQTGGTTTFKNVVTSTGTSTTVSLIITSAVGEMTNDAFTAAVGSATPTQALLFFLSGSGPEDGGSSEGVGAATVTHQWTIASAAWGDVGCSIKAA